jgi:hypothetical protein
MKPSVSAFFRSVFSVAVMAAIVLVYIAAWSGPALLVNDGTKGECRADNLIGERLVRRRYIRPDRRIFVPPVLVLGVAGVDCRLRSDYRLI